MGEKTLLWKDSPDTYTYIGIHACTYLVRNNLCIEWPCNNLNTHLLWAQILWPPLAWAGFSAALSDSECACVEAKLFYRENKEFRFLWAKKSLWRRILQIGKWKSLCYRVFQFQVLGTGYTRGEWLEDTRVLGFVWQVLEMSLFVFVFKWYFFTQRKSS